MDPVTNKFIGYRVVTRYVLVYHPEPRERHRKSVRRDTSGPLKRPAEQMSVRLARPLQCTRKNQSDQKALGRDVMTAQIINLSEYRKTKAAWEVRKIVSDYFAEHSKAMAWWQS